MLQIKQLINNPASSNCFVIYDKAYGNNCLIVDPGSEDCSNLYEFLKSENLNPQFIILTHEHFDHCWGVNAIRQFYPTVKLICSSKCSIAIQDKKKNHSVFFQQPGFDVSPADIIFEDINWNIDWYNCKILFYPAQGHTVSGVIFTIDSFLFTGDELIKDLKTVTKLRTGSKERLQESLKLLVGMKGNRLIICPGHGEMFELDDYDLTKAYKK